MLKNSPEARAFIKFMGWRLAGTLTLGSLAWRGDTGAFRELISPD